MLSSLFQGRTSGVLDHPDTAMSHETHLDGEQGPNIFSRNLKFSGNVMLSVPLAQVIFIHG